MRRLWAAVPLSLLVVSAMAATLERLSLDDMIVRSTQVVRGRVLRSTAVLRGALIQTVHQLDVEEVLKGAPGRSVSVVTHGGSLGGIQQTFAGSPKLELGKEYVLFVWTGRSGVPQLMGLSQGALQVRRGLDGATTASREAITDTVLDPQSGRVVVDHGLEVRLSELRQRMQQVLGGAR